MADFARAPHLRIAGAILLALAMTAAAQEKGPSRQEGEYHVYLSGQEAGVEKYSIVSEGGKVSARSKLEFRNPGPGPKTMTLECKMEMDLQLVPQKYELKSTLDGQQGTIIGSFAPNQAIFEFSGNGTSSRSGLLVPGRYTILDTNIFHHFVLLARLFQYGRGKTPQSFEVVIPREKDTGTLSISESGEETVQIRGKTVRLTRLLIDSGSMKIHLWVDNRRVPLKISLPDKGIEIVHGN